MPEERLLCENRQSSSQQIPSPEPQRSSFAWCAADFLVLMSWLAVVVTVLPHHEKWADEAEAWLMARDVSLPNIWFKELRYEGSPGAWHTLLWVLQHVFHLPYSGLGAVAVVCAFAGVLFVVLRAPFPRPIRYLLVFSYYMIYQYAVIARQYVLLPLLAFVPALLFKDTEHPERMTVALILLANISFHGTVLAGCIGAAYLLQAIGRWKALSASVRRRYLISIAVMLGVFLFLLAILLPPADAEALRQVHHSFSVVAVRAWDGMRGSTFDNAALSALWLTLLLAWCLVRKGWALLTPILMLALSILYGRYGAPHHQGTILVAAMTGLWIAWPSAEEARSFGRGQRYLHRALVIGLACMLSYQTWNGMVAMRNDYRYPYCGARDAANYLRSVGAEHQKIMGYGYGMVAVDAYFDHNIQVNRPTAYFHHGGKYVLPSAHPMAELKHYDPDYAVFPCWGNCEATVKSSIGPFMHDAGYTLVHFSDGYLFDKRGWDAREAYLIYRKNR